MMLRTKTDFEKMADQIADEYMAGQGELPINKLAQQVATQNNLNPEQIRTMVRLANVAVFGKVFQSKTGEDRNIKFAVGDPELVIDTLYSHAKEAQTGTHSREEGTRAQDYYGDFYPLESVPEQEKIAEDMTVTFTGTPRALAERIKRALDQFTMDSQQAAQRWKLAMETAASVCKKNYGVKVAEIFPAFEKDVLCTDARLGPEVSALRSMILRDKVASHTSETLVQWQEHHVADLDKDTREVLGFLKQAGDARDAYTNCLECCAKAEEGLSKLRLM
jgi:hypothetical protein